MSWAGADIENKQESIDRTLESKADEVARFERRIDDVVERLEAIESTVSNIARDEEMQEALQETRNQREREKLDEQQYALTLQDDLAFLLNLVGEGEENTARDSDALAALRAIGEDVGEAESIVEERQAWAEETKEKIKVLMERIGGKVTEPGLRVTASRRPLSNIDDSASGMAGPGFDFTGRYAHPGEESAAKFREMVELGGSANPSSWIQYGNPNFASGGFQWILNCGSCARSFADTYQGKSAIPAMGDSWGTGEYEEMWDALGVRPASRLTNLQAEQSLFQVSAYQALASSLAREGPGAVAIIGVDWDIPEISRAESGGHWFNAYVEADGSVRWADEQLGKIGGWPPCYDNCIWKIEAVFRKSANAPWKELVL